MLLVIIRLIVVFEIIKDLRASGKEATRTRYYKALAVVGGDDRIFR